MLQTIKKCICTVCKFAVSAILVSVTAITVVQVVSRYVFRHYNYAMEELSVLALIWAVAFGVPWMWLERQHISMDAIDNLLTAGGKRILTTLINLLAFVVGACLLWSGLRAARVNHGFVYTTLGVDEALRYLPIALMGLLLCVAVVIVMIEDWRARGNE